MHVAILAGWVDYAAVAREWRRALECEGAAPPDWGQRAQRRHRVSASAAANYIAKYMAKPCDADDVQLAARAYEASYARRLTHASRGFWEEDPVGCCGVTWHRVACDEWHRLDGAVVAAQEDIRRYNAQRAPPLHAARADIARYVADSG
jgi:hypothetical protein